MVKSIKIGSSTYDMKSSAFTIFAYKNFTGKNLLEDIGEFYSKYNKINNLSEQEQTETWFSEITKIIEPILKLSYVMIKEQNKDFKSYEDWLKDIDDLFENPNWTEEVLELGLSPFSGRILNAQNK